MNKWLSTNDAPPEELIPILFYAYNEYYNARFVCFGMWNGTQYVSYEDSGTRRYDEDDVTHWMKAPKPPEI